MTDPPLPPRPPSGPPRGLYFSRLKETLPSPPRPAHTTNRASSTNCNGARDPQNTACSGSGPRGSPQRDPFGVLDDAHDALATRARVIDLARDLGEEGVVGALADVHAGVDLRAALADYDTSGRDD